MRLRLLAALLLAAAPAFADDSPIVLTHYGRLLNADDTPVTGTVSMEIRLYTRSDGNSSTIAWSERYQVPVTNGVYAVVLGDTRNNSKPLTAADVNGERWLAVVIGTEELSPRMALGTVPTAINAKNLGGVAAANYALKTDAAPDAAKLGGVAAANYALKTDAAPDAAKLGGVVASDYALKTDIVTDAAKLGGLTASSYALKTDTAPDAAKLGGLAVSSYALKTDTAPDAAKLGGLAVSSYALKTDTAPDAAKLGGLTASSYALASHNHDGVYARLSGQDLAVVGTGTFGALALSPTTSAAPTCDAALAGRMYFNATEQVFYACTGDVWVAFAATPVGSLQTKPGMSCKDIQARASFLGDGSYWVDPDGTGGAAPYRVYCDMSTAGGGWTLAMQIGASSSVDATFGFSSTHWTTASVLNDTAPSSLSSINAKYSTFNSFVSSTGLILIVDRKTGRFSELSIPGLAGQTLLARFQSLSDTVLSLVAGQGSPQELMGYPAPTGICRGAGAKWQMNMTASYAGARLGNDVASNDAATNDVSSWTCYDGPGQENLAYSGVGGTLDNGRQWQDGFGSESLNRWRSNSGTGQGSHNGVAIYLQ